VIVVDSSAVLDLLLNRPSAEALRDRLFAPRETLHAPYLLDLDVVQVFRRHLFAGSITHAEAATLLDCHFTVPIERYPHDPLWQRVWSLRENVTAYDAIYVALAETLGVALVTADGELAKAIA